MNQLLGVAFSFLRLSLLQMQCLHWHLTGKVLMSDTVCYKVNGNITRRHVISLATNMRTIGCMLHIPLAGGAGGRPCSYWISQTYLVSSDIASCWRYPLYVALAALGGVQVCLNGSIGVWVGAKGLHGAHSVHIAVCQPHFMLLFGWDGHGSPTHQSWKNCHVTLDCPVQIQKAAIN
jgi:hypothetical protein